MQDGVAIRESATGTTAGVLVHEVGEKYAIGAHCDLGRQPFCVLSSHSHRKRIAYTLDVHMELFSGK